MIIIENRNSLTDEKAILKSLGKKDFEYKGETTLEECIYPRDNSLNIGFYNGNILITDDYQITNNSLANAKSLALTNEEKTLVEIFPASEIIMVACHSAMNYHGYSLIRNGKKTRLKTIVPGEAAKEFGERTIEEEMIYKNSYEKNGFHYWHDESDPESGYSEDQLMETFTFEFAKRRLGVLIDHSEADELMSNTTFKKFIKPNVAPTIETYRIEKWFFGWWPYIILIGVLIIWQILKRTVFKN